MIRSTQGRRRRCIRPGLPVYLGAAAARLVRGGADALLFGLLGLTLLGGPNALAQEFKDIRLASGFDLQTAQYAAEGRHLLIWIPSKYGVRAGHPEFGSAVQREGIDFWLIDLHTSYRAPRGRHAYEQFRSQHIKELIDHAVLNGWQSIVLGGESRGAALAMQAARQWQIENPGCTALKGMLFYHPHLIDGHTAIGERADFLPIARSTNLPIYLFQPQHSSKYLHSQELVEQLQLGGTAVYFHFLPGVRGGFHIRPAAHLSPREAEERDLVGERIRHAVNLLARLPSPKRAAVPAVDPTRARPAEVAEQGALTPLRTDQVPPLRLVDGSGQWFDLAEHPGEVILVNFWASWCNPCVKEIASLTRLVERFEGQPFRVLAVNVGESTAHVAAFFQELGISPNFDVLFDLDGEAARAWKVYAVPSTYLLDRQQGRRYGHRGALRWDQSSVVDTVQDLLQ